MLQKIKITNKRFLFLSTLVLVVISNVYVLYDFAISSYPVLEGDAACFMPCTVNYASGQGLINTIWHPKHVYNPAHPEWLTWHGFLFSMLSGTFAPSPSYSGARISMFYMQLIILLSMFFIMIKLSWGKFNFKVWVLIVAALFTVESYCVQTGRPELLVSMWISAGILLGLYLPKYKWIIAGFVLGLTAITSPIPALFLGLICVIYLSKSNNWRSLIRILLQVGSACLSAIIVGFAFYPYSFFAWLQGVRLHSAVAFGSWGFDQLFFYNYFWIKATNSTFYGVLFLTTCGFFFVYWKNLMRIQKLISAVFVLVLALLFWKTVGSAPERIYNITALTTLFVVFVFYQSISANKTKYDLKFRIATAVFLLCSLAFVRTVFLFPSYKNHGLSYSDASIQFNSFLNDLENKNVKIGVTSGLFTLIPSKSNIEIIRNESKIADKFDYVVIQQVYSEKISPNPIPNFQLISNNFSPHTVEIQGKRISNVYIGYNYAIYKRQ